MLSTQHYPFGPLRTLQFGNTRTLTRHYDTNYAIDSIESTQPGGLVLELDTDVAGNITAIGNLNGSPPQRQYSYDAFNRLTEMRGGGEPMETYTYSPTGDRCPRRWSGPTRNWEPIRVVTLNPERCDSFALTSRKAAA